MFNTVFLMQVNNANAQSRKEISLEENFFKEQTDSSRIKANIVAEYFPQYCRIIDRANQREIRYLDLFAGPGKYDDGNDSTPLLLANACAADATLRKKVRLLFNDNFFAEQLKYNFEDRFTPGTFELPPSFADKTVGEDERIERYLSREAGESNPNPTLLFFDPFGYKGINTQVLSKFLVPWGNELFLFVNTKRIHAAIENNKFDDLMQSLFPTSIEQLRKDRKYKATVEQRLALIMDNLADEFAKATNVKLYHCAFKFQEEDSTGTSHFIIHFSKSSKGYALVKQVYHDYDNIGATLVNDSVYMFDAKRMGNAATSTIDFGDQNVATLSHELETKYTGKTISAKALFDHHQPTTKWCGSHYVKTLRDMVDRGKIQSNFTDNINHKRSVLLTENCILQFK